MRDSRTLPDTVAGGELIQGDTGDEGHLLQVHPGGVKSWGLSVPSGAVQVPTDGVGGLVWLDENGQLVRHGQHPRGVHAAGRP